MGKQDMNLRHTSLGPSWWERCSDAVIVTRDRIHSIKASLPPSGKLSAAWLTGMGVLAV